VQPDRKALRAALATLGSIQRKLVSSPALVASCVSVVGCTHETRLVPLWESSVRQGTGQVEQHGDGHVLDKSGEQHEISRDTMLDTASGEHVSVGSLIDACRVVPRGSKECLLDRPHVDWSFEDRHLAVDRGAITGVVALGLAAALVYGNYECFGPGCSTGAKVGVGVGDALVVLSGIALFEIAKGIGASSSCGPLAPPCMPREETT
jgi:hypothetical protein